MADNPGNESENSTTIEDLLRRILTSTMVQPINDGNSRDSIILPSFKPGKDEPDVWIADVEEIAASLSWTEVLLLVKVQNYLVGEAAEWFLNWRPADGRNWENFKRDFLESFTGITNFGKLMHEAINFNSIGCVSYGNYGRKKLQQLNSLHVNFTQDQLVSLICFGIKDVTLQNQFIQMGHQNVTPLLAHLSRIQFKPPNRLLENKNKTNLFDENSKAREVKCFNCSKIGHKKADCPNKSFKRKSDFPVTITDTKILTCNFCKKTGHVSENCFKKRRLTKNFCNTDEEIKSNNHYINILQLTNETTSPITTPLYSLLINKSLFQVLLDTGAQLSLVRENKSKLITSDIFLDHTIITGVGNKTINSKFSLHCKVILDSIEIPLKLHIVSKNEIPCDVIIGVDFLNTPGVSLIYKNNLPLLKYITPIVNEMPKLLDNLIQEFDDIVSSKDKSPPFITTGEFKIRLISDKEIKYRPYRLSFSERETVKQIVQELLNNSIIRISKSPFASPILLVKKKNGESRMVCDFRALNRITVKDRFPLPRIDDQIDRLSRSKYFSILDMKSGFHQIKVHDESIEKLAFVTPDGHYEYLRMPFGLANAPAIFQRAITDALQSEINEGIALIYIDDILLPSDTREEGLSNLKRVFMTLRKFGFTINIKKCIFLQEEVEYLGRLIKKGDVRPSPSKTDALKILKPPTNIKQVRQFLGLAGYFRKFIPSFSIKMKPISNLLKKDEPWFWNEEHTNAFNYVINVLTNEPVLAIYDPTLPIELHTDASSLGFGAIIFQIHNGLKRVVAYYSKTTSEAESRYHSYELETLAVVYALKSFRHYFAGIEFKLITDCNSLKTTQHKRDLIPRISRWWMFLQDFNFTIEHRPGNTMAYVDYLSRNHPETHFINVNIGTAENDIEMEVVNLMPEGWLFIQQSNDSETITIKDKLLNNELDKNQFCIIGNTLCHVAEINGEKITQYFVPKNARFALLKEYHDGQNHIGIDKTLLSLNTHFWFPKMRSVVKKYIEACLTCLTKKRLPSTTFHNIYSIEKVALPFHTLHIDCLGPLPKTEDGFCHIFVAVDAYSKYCFLYGLKSLQTDEIADCVMDMVYLIGTPARIISDNGASLKALPKHHLLLEWDIYWHFITPYAHEANGQVERYMRFIANLLRVESEASNEWSTRLSRVQLVINSTVHKTTAKTPLQTLFGCDNRLPEISRIIKNASSDKLPVSHQPQEKWREFIKKRLDENAERQQKQVSKAVKKVLSFEVGDFVLIQRQALKPSKFESGWHGPFKIINKNQNDRYDLRRIDDISESTKLTSAVAYQMRLWPKELSPEDCSDVLEFTMQDELESQVIIENDHVSKIK